MPRFNKKTLIKPTNMDISIIHKANGLISKITTLEYCLEALKQKKETEKLILLIEREGRGGLDVIQKRVLFPS
jgi:hypothetical protein